METFWEQEQGWSSPFNKKGRSFCSVGFFPWVFRALIFLEGGLSIPGLWCPHGILGYPSWHHTDNLHYPPRQVVLQPCWLPKIQLLFVASSQPLNEDHGPIENLPRFMVGFVETEGLALIGGFLIKGRMIRYEPRSEFKSWFVYQKHGWWGSNQKTGLEQKNTNPKPTQLKWFDDYYYDNCKKPQHFQTQITKWLTGFWGQHGIKQKLLEMTLRFLSMQFWVFANHVIQSCKLTAANWKGRFSPTFELKISGEYTTIFLQVSIMGWSWNIHPWSSTAGTWDFQPLEVWRFRIWKPSFSAYMLNFRGVSHF